VIMEYHPRYFAFSALLSLVALLAAAGVFGWQGLRRRRTGK